MMWLETYRAIDEERRRKARRLTQEIIALRQSGDPDSMARIIRLKQQIRLLFEG